MNKWILISILFFLSWMEIEVMAGVSFNRDPTYGFNDQIRLKLSKAYPNAEIELLGPIRWIRVGELDEVKKVTLLGDDSQGNAHIFVGGENSESSSEGWVSFAAWIVSYVPIKRVRPGEALNPENFSQQKINTALGLAKEYRGVILSVDTSLAQLEATQTLLEGQFISNTAVRRIPDIRRGDAVQVQLRAGGLTLYTQGIAEEPAYLKQKVRVLTQKYKKELLGNLMPGGIVEVNL